MKRKKFNSDPVFGGKYLKAKKNLTITKSPQILKMLKMIVLSHRKKDPSAYLSISNSGWFQIG